MKLIEIDGDTAYVEHTHDCLQPLKKPLYDTIDWLALAKQKLRLLDVIQVSGHDDKNCPLHGLVALIDNIQDDAEAKGYPVVWIYPAAIFKDGKLNLNAEK